ncbi:hypothetical protein PAECIP111892_05235 [Paenibacillus auburnensis]|uniref:Uncharacterized protein n=1 Tax=Paenibacillus auburnensis TaxID=2905649 RepID=A0ABN8H4C3_9BACL|nr:hypothetical protein PAECIP111892_05235 [Paenibacillus auburnensis]
MIDNGLIKLFKNILDRIIQTQIVPVYLPRFSLNRYVLFNGTPRLALYLKKRTEFPKTIQQITSEHS